MGFEPGEAGITVDRRTLFRLPIALPAGALVLGAPILARDADMDSGAERSDSAFAPLTRAEFVKHWQELCREMNLAPLEHDESYAAQLAGLIARVPIEALPTVPNPRGENGLSGGLSWRLLPGVTVEFRMEPGAVLRLHNHPPQVVVTLCAEGETRYRHFEVDGDAPPCTTVDGAEFRVRETRAGILGPRRTTSLTRARDGIHGFEAGPLGARIIDFTLALTEDVDTFSYLELSAAPLDRERCVYGARWIGKG